MEHMSEESDRTRLHLQREEAVQTKPPAFQEAPGEGEAEAVRDAFLKGAGPTPADLAAGLNSADAVTRSRALNRLQQERGNAYVQRVIAEAQGTPGRLVGLSQPQMVDEVASRKGG